MFTSCKFDFSQFLWYKMVSRESEDFSGLLHSWVQENSRLRIDLIGVVFSNTVRMTTEEENELQKVIFYILRTL